MPIQSPDAKTRIVRWGKYQRTIQVDKGQSETHLFVVERIGRGRNGIQLHTVDIDDRSTRIISVDTVGGVVNADGSVDIPSPRSGIYFQNGEPVIVTQTLTRLS